MSQRRPGGDYCALCGEAPDSGTHTFASNGHTFQRPPPGAYWMFKAGTCKKLLVLPTGVLP